MKIEARRDSRIKQKMPVSWRIKDSEATSRGRVQNISTSGMRLQVSSAMALEQGCVLAVQPAKNLAENFLPSLGRVVWSKKQGIRPQQWLCGIEFIEPAQETIARIHQKVCAALAWTRKFEIAKAVIGSLLLIGVIALTAFILFQQSVIHQDIARSNRVLFATAGSQAKLYRSVVDRSQAQEAVIVQISQDLNATKGLLSETEAMLGTARGQMATLQAKNNDLSAELSAVNAELTEARAWVISESNVTDRTEARSVIHQYKQRVRDIYAKIRNLKKRVRLAEREAQRERDRVALQYGNQGYMTKDAQPYRPWEAQKKINVSVSTFE